MKILFAALLAFAVTLLAGYLVLLYQQKREDAQRSASRSDITAAAASPRPGRITASEVTERRSLPGTQMKPLPEDVREKE